MTGTLIRKDVRLLRPVIWTAIGLGLVFYAIGPALVFVSWRHDAIEKEQALAAAVHRPPVGLTAQQMVKAAADTVASSSGFMWFINALLVTTVAGMAFAVERRERWGDLVGLMPVSRSRAVAAKSAASAGVAAGIVAVNLAVTALGIGMSSGWQAFYGGSDWERLKFFEVIFCFVATAVGMAGVAWLLSSLLRSAVIATSVGLGVVFGVWCFALLLQNFPDAPRPTPGSDDIERVAATVILLIGVVGLLVGTIVQLRRQSP